MTNKEILEKAIQKAIDGGWDSKTDWDVDNCPYGLIFNHNFAKALWGDGFVLEEYWVDRMAEYGRGNVLSSWQMGPERWVYNLQRMIIAEDPIKYLGENI